MTTLTSEETDNYEFTDSKLTDKDLVETVMHMVQLEFLELELMQQETKVSCTT